LPKFSTYRFEVKIYVLSKLSKKPSLFSKYFQECNENVNKTETMAKKHLFCWRYLKKPYKKQTP
jgi:hypothetical protein